MVRVNQIEVGGNWIFNLDLDYFCLLDGDRFLQGEWVCFYFFLKSVMKCCNKCVLIIVMSLEIMGLWVSVEVLLVECWVVLGFDCYLQLGGVFDCVRCSWMQYWN